MTSAARTVEAGWRDRLFAAVTPLASGTRTLKVSGYHPPGARSFRPSRTAAVLVPLIDDSKPEVVLTRRADNLPLHAGQVSFPGGAVDERDATAVQTAMREAFEEIGLPPERVTPIGFLDRLDTITDFRVLPVVALVLPPVVWTPDFREVAEVFTVPLAHVLNLNNYAERTVERGGMAHRVWYLEWRSHLIWGATAAMLLNLAQRFEGARGR